MLRKLLGTSVCLSFVGLVIAACAPASEDTSDGDGDFEQEAISDESELSSAVDCTREKMEAFQGGRSLGEMDTFKIGENRVGMKTGHAFLKLQKAARARGVDVWINSGFRTMDEQRYFWGCYQSRRCNGGHKAARPGFSNHQHGRALDLSSSNRPKLNRIIAELRLDWRRTVPGEAWHYEYFGPDVGGVCDGNASASGDGAGGDDTDAAQPSAGNEALTGCFSPTLDKRVEEKACVQSRTGKWYQCKTGAWEEGGGSGTGPFGECTSKTPH